MASYNELPKGWNRIPLREAGVSVTGNTPPTKDAENYGGKLPYIKPPQLRNNIFSEGEETLSEKGKSLARVLPPNSVLVSCIGNLGRTGLNQVSVAFNQQINAVIPNSSILPKFLFYQAQSSDFRNQLEGKSTATTISIVNKGNFEKVLINLAPLNEQKNIVAKIEELFSELDSGIASLKTAREQLKIYRQALLKHAFEGKLTEQWRKNNADKLETPEQLLAYIQTERETRYQQQLNDWKQAVKDWEAKGKEGKKPRKPQITILKKETVANGLFKVPSNWAWCQFGSLYEMISGFAFKKADYSSGGIRLFQIANVSFGRTAWEEVTYLPEEFKKKFPELVLNEGDVVMALNRPMLGDRLKISRLGKLDTPSILYQRVGKFIFYNQEVSSYFLYFLQSVHFTNRLKEELRGVNIPFINQTRLAQYFIPICSKLEQQEIVNQLEEKLSIVEQNEKEIEDALAKAELLRQSILKKAFSGQLHLGEKL